MGLIGKLVGTPQDHKEEKAKAKVVTAPEFDITQYAKKLGVSIGVIAAAAASALKLFKVEQVTSGMVIAAFGLTAAALLGVSIVMAVDLAARAYLTGSSSGGSGSDGAGDEPRKEESEAGGPDSMSELIAAPPGTAVWLENDEEPHPVLGISTVGGKVSYLVAAGSTIKRPSDHDGVKAIDGSPEWLPSEAIQAVKPAKWA